MIKKKVLVNKAAVNNKLKIIIVAFSVLLLIFLSISTISARRPLKEIPAS